MSATSEELASQAEELQSSLTFFQTSDNGDSQARKSRVPIAPVRKAAPPAQPVRKPMANRSVAAQQARAKGFALDLSMGGPDAEDDRFHQLT